MNKSNYFSHNFNANRDPKVIKLLKNFGWEGYELNDEQIKELIDSSR